MNRVVIDLDSARTGAEVLSILGKALELGGPDGNTQVRAINQGSGWGMNWDALRDSLCYLDSGGIWGTSKVFEFPLRLEIQGAIAFKEASPEEYGYLAELLGEAAALYAQSGLKFSYALS